MTGPGSKNAAHFGDRVEEFAMPDEISDKHIFHRKKVCQLVYIFLHPIDAAAGRYIYAPGSANIADIGRMSLWDSKGSRQRTIKRQER